MENHIYYTQRINSCKNEYAKANKTYHFFGTLRLLTFMLMLFSIFVFWGAFYSILVVAIFFILFLYLVHRSIDAKYKRDKIAKLLVINERELEVLNGNWHHFKDGSDYKDPQHPFSHDMDLFGSKSVFQLLNRTVSRKGSNLLADQLLSGTTNPTLSNDAIKDLSKQQDWCQEFLAEGMIYKEEDLEKEFEKLKNITYTSSLFANIVRIAIPVLSISFTVLYGFNVILDTFFLIYIISVFMIISQNLKKTNLISREVNSYGGQTKMYIKQLAMFENVTINSDLFIQERAKLFSKDENLQDSLMELAKIQQRMDYRMNILVGAILNFFLAWDFQILNQWEQWRSKKQAYLGSWEKQLAQIEVWISGAVYYYNFPECNFADFSTDNSIEIIGLGHPFVSKNKRVVNDVKMKDSEHFMVITGPNMAGKSTYLRSLGLVFISANAGFPILAESCSVPNFKLYSSMRTTDDLNVESSYFHAELTRLRFIMDAIERGEKVYIILDEILKGTNSKDKEIGSAKFLKKLVRLNARGVIATHDLSLCKLADESNSFKNMYFDSIIEGDDLSFDYLIREGICQNMNASFLLKKMDLVD